MAQQTINLGAAPDDGTGDTLRAGGDKINDNFDELYDETLKLKGSTDCSTNPNYPAASKADSYRVSVAGKIGGASGIDVEIGDFYYALADNAGGTQAAVGSSWDVLQGNTTGTGGSVDVEDEGIAVAAATVLNFTGAGVVATDAGGGQVDVTIAGGGGGVDIEDEGVAEATGATVLNFTGAGVTATDVGAGQVDIDIPGGSGALTLIEEQTPTATGTLTFSGIAATYRDLIVVARGRSDRAAQASSEIYIQFNGDTANNYDYVTNNLSGTTNSAAQANATDKIVIGWLTGATATAGAAGSGQAWIYNYRDTNYRKQVVADGSVKTTDGAAGQFRKTVGGEWRSTSAITSVTVLLQGGNYLTGTVISLYGRM